jgi:hypothetical protein
MQNDGLFMDLGKTLRHNMEAARAALNHDEDEEEASIVATTNVIDADEPSEENAPEQGTSAPGMKPPPIPELRQTDVVHLHERVSDLGTEDELPIAGFDNGFGSVIGVRDGSHVWISALRGGERGAPGFANSEECWRVKAFAGYSVSLYKKPPGGLSNE